MKAFKIKTFIICLIGIVLLSGCAKFVPLSPEDEEKCAIYAAGIINKHNKRQSRGIVAVNLKEDQAAEATDTPENANPEGNSESSGNAENSESQVEGTNLTDTVGIPGISFAYKESVVSQDYGVDAGFLVSPKEGNSFVTVIYTVSNTTSSEIGCDIQSRALNFSASLGDVTSSLERTVLSNDLTLYNSTIPGNQSVDLALQFQFPTNLTGDLSGLKLNCTKDGVNYHIPL